MKIQKDLGKKLKMIRHDKGLTQANVAKELEISTPAYSKIETGITDVSISRLSQIASFYGTTAVELLTFDLPEISDVASDPADLKTIIGLQTKFIELYERFNGNND